MDRDDAWLTCMSSVPPCIFPVELSTHEKSKIAPELRVSGWQLVVLALEPRFQAFKSKRS